MRYIGHFILFICFIFSFSTFSEEGQECSGGSQESLSSTKPRFCFFSLNGKDESEGICEAIRKDIKKNQKQTNHSKQESTGMEIVIDQDNGKTENFTECENLPDEYKERIEIVEYYADNLVEENSPPTEEKNIEEAFRDMTKDRCDALAISGHHVGYFTGSEQKNRDRENVALTLDFLEKFSCHKDEQCQAWFNNIKMLHLHGARTWGEEGGIADHNRINHLLDKYPNWDKEKIDLPFLYREYANTVGNNNPLSKRYLRIFPQAAILAWSGDAIAIPNSAPTLISHIQNISDNKNFLEDFDKFLEFLLPDDTSDITSEQICLAWKGYRGQRATWDHKEEDNIAQDRDKGCELAQAIKPNNEEGMQTAMRSILTDPRANELIHQNLNRIFNAVNNDNKTIRDNMIQALKEDKNIQNIIQTQVAGAPNLVRKADYLALYKRIWPEDTEIASMEEGFLKEVNDELEAIQEGSYCQGSRCKDMKEVTAEMLAEIIWKNNLGLTQVSDGQNILQDIMGNIRTVDKESNVLRMHSLLVELSFAKKKLSETDEIADDELHEKIKTFYEKLPPEDSSISEDFRYYIGSMLYDSQWNRINQDWLDAYDDFRNKESGTE